MKTENFSRTTQKCISQGGFGEGLIHKKKKKKYLYLSYMYESHSEKAKNPKKRPEFCMSSRF